MRGAGGWECGRRGRLSLLLDACAAASASLGSSRFRTKTLRPPPRAASCACTDGEPATRAVEVRGMRCRAWLGSAESECWACCSLQERQPGTQLNQPNPPPCLQTGALAYYGRACRSSSAGLLQPNGTVPLCEPFAVTGRRRMSECLLEAANLPYTLCVSPGSACSGLACSSSTGC